MTLDPEKSEPAQRRVRVSIKSVLVVTAVFAASAMSLGHLIRAAMGDKGEIGQFVIITAMLPMIVLVAASLFFKIFGRIVK